jgi:hypothetical protein
MVNDCLNEVNFYLIAEMALNFGQTARSTNAEWRLRSQWISQIFGWLLKICEGVRATPDVRFRSDVSLSGQKATSARLRTGAHAALAGDGGGS